MNDMDKLTGFKAIKRNEILNYFKNLPEQHIIDICFELSLINEKDKDPVAVYSKFLTLINERFQVETASSRKYQLSEKETELAKEIKRSRVSRRKPKKSPVYDTVRKKYIQLIKDLREEDLSWRQIALYLQMNHKVRISHVYIRSIYMEEYSGKTDT